MKKKVLLRGPVLSQSGYGEQARFAMRALKTREDIFDIFIENLNWGKTTWLWEDTEEREWIDQQIGKTAHYKNQGGQFDVSIQCTIPNEWEKLAPVNIGYTAGIETTKVAPEWIQKSFLMDKIVVVSEHSKQVYKETTYQAQDQRTGEVIPEFRTQVPIETVNYPFREAEPEPFDLQLKNDFNFLCVAQWSVRKNLENTIRWFVEEFIDKEVGLVIKTSIAKNCVMDYQLTSAKLEELLGEEKYKGRKCSVHLVHGYLSEGEMSYLYQHPGIKAMINIGHGEGYGLPLFEAAGYGLPIIAVPWSGHCDFLYVEKKKGEKVKRRPKFCKVDYDLKPIPKEAVWKGVLQEDSLWAYADQGDFKMKLRDMVRNLDKYEAQANELKTWVRENFTEEKMYGEFIKEALSPSEEYLENLKWKESFYSNPVEL